METLAGFFRNHPQSAYAVLQKSLQQEWAFVQRVNLGIGNAFGPVEKELRGTFMPALFEGLGEGAQEQGVARLPVKQAGFSLPDLTLTDPENWTASYVIIGHLVAALRVQVEFWTSYHSECIWEGRAEV